MTLPEWNGLVMNVYPFYDSEAALSVLIDLAIVRSGTTTYWILALVDNESTKAHCLDVGWTKGLQTNTWEKWGRTDQISKQRWQIRYLTLPCYLVEEECRKKMGF